MSENGDTFQHSNTENENSKKTRKKYFNETKDYDGHDRIYAREEDYCDHYYENEIPLKRVTVNTVFFNFKCLIVSFIFYVYINLLNGFLISKSFKLT